MGNFNGDKTDEFILPNGTQLADPAGFTEEEIYNQYGNECTITFVIHYARAV